MREYLQELWDNTKPAPSGVKECQQKFPRFIHLAFEGCFELVGYDISALEWEEQTPIFLAALDAELDGERQAKEAAAAALVGLAISEGWEECLYQQ